MIPHWLRRLICFPQFNLDIRVSPADLRVFSTFRFLLFVQLKKKFCKTFFSGTQWDPPESPVREASQQIVWKSGPVSHAGSPSNQSGLSLEVNRNKPPPDKCFRTVTQGV